MRVHLDTDLGGDIDDVCALALLLRWPGVELVGITTVAEDHGRRAGYARAALQLAGRGDVPVAAGAEGPRHRYRDPVVFPNEAAYWPEPVTPCPGTEDDALALLRRSVDAGATIVAVGPYTNLALFDRAFPRLLERVPLSLMGGHVRPVPPGFPNWDHRVDWNVQQDVASAQHVLSRLRPTLVPLEVTVQTALRRASLPELDEAGLLGRLLARQARAWAADERIEETYGRACAGLPDDTINFLHDPLACAVALGWGGVVVEELPLVLELRDGWLCERVDSSAGHALRVVTSVDGPRFDALWLEVVCH